MCMCTERSTTLLGISQDWILDTNCIHAQSPEAVNIAISDGKCFSMEFRGKNRLEQQHQLNSTLIFVSKQYRLYILYVFIKQFCEKFRYHVFSTSKKLLNGMRTIGWIAQHSSPYTNLNRLVYLVPGRMQVHYTCVQIFFMQNYLSICKIGAGHVSECDVTSLMCG